MTGLGCKIPNPAPLAVVAVVRLAGSTYNVLGTLLRLLWVRNIRTRLHECPRENLAKSQNSPDGFKLFTGFVRSYSVTGVTVEWRRKGLRKAAINRQQTVDVGDGSRVSHLGDSKTE